MRREIVKIPVPDDDLRCCDAEKKLIGTRVRVTIEYRPGEAYAVEEHAEVRACAICEGNVSTAPTTPPPIEGARPGPGMLAQIVTSKNSDAVPIERQSKILARGGAPIAPSTLGDWYARAADLVEPLSQVLRDDTLARYLISLDDTGLAVLSRGHARGIKRGHIWTFLGDGGEVAFCEYTPDWKGKWPQATLAAFRGQVIQSDGYAGLAPIFERPNAPRRAGCMDQYLESAVIWSEEPRSRSSVGNRPQAARTVPDNAALQGLQEREHARRWLPAGAWLALEAGALPERLEHLPLHVEVGCQIAARGGDARVSQIVADDAHVDPGLKECNSAAVPEDVGRDVTTAQRRPCLGRLANVLFDEVRDAIAGERRAARIAEDRLVRSGIIYERAQRNHGLAP
jgi:transposase